MSANNEIKATPNSIAEEPWVRLPNGKDLRSWGRDEQIVYNQQRRHSAKHEFYQSAFDFLNANEIIGDYLEFGCHRARTFRMALTEARRQNMAKMRFFAFDSFAGLPVATADKELSASGYTPGMLATAEEEFRSLVTQHGIYCENVETIGGFFKDSLTKKLQAELVDRGVKTSFVNVDCDLYESAVEVFHFIEPFIQKGTVIYIDDYFVGYYGSPLEGVGKAFNEFCKRCEKFTFAPYLSIGAFGLSFIACGR